MMPMENQVDARELGSTGLKVFPIALGCMGMSGIYGAADENESIATIHAALDAGVTLLDTGDFYGAGHNEMLLGLPSGAACPLVRLPFTGVTKSLILLPNRTAFGENP
jgi:predicted oxidoreductase